MVLKKFVVLTQGDTSMCFYTYLIFFWFVYLETTCQYLGKSVALCQVRDFFSVAVIKWFTGDNIAKSKRKLKSNLWLISCKEHRSFLRILGKTIGFLKIELRVFIRICRITLLLQNGSERKNPALFLFHCQGRFENHSKTKVSCYR